MSIVRLAASTEINTAPTTLIIPTATPQYTQTLATPVAPTSILSSQPPPAIVASLISLSNTSAFAFTLPLPSYTAAVVNSTSDASPIITSTLTTSAPASTDTSQTSITPTSTTTSPSTSASPSSTASADISASDASHHAPFYIAIILGTIVVIGLIATVIAWIVRLRLHARRQRQRGIPNVPWANHQNEGSVEEARDVVFIGQPINRIGSKDISSQDVGVPWEPRGDRDVGEPKRSSSYVRGTANWPVRSAETYADTTPPYPVGQGAMFPLPVYDTYATREPQYYPDSDGSLDGHRSVSTLGPLQVANMAPGDISAESSPVTPVNVRPQSSFKRDRDMYGIPPEDRSGTWPRFANNPNRRAGGSGGRWERLPVPGETHYAGSMTAGDGSWAASVKSNLNQAFNTMASRFPSHEDRGERDNLTPRPRQCSGRRFLARADYLPNGDESSNSRPRQRNITKKFAPEEHGDAVTENLSPYNQADGRYEPRVLDSCLTLDSPSAGASICRMSTYDSHDPLLTRRPQSAVLRPDAYADRFKEGGNAEQRQLSTRSATSVYSIASAGAPPRSAAEAPYLPAFSRQSTIKVDALHPVNEIKVEEGNRAQQRPDSLVTRSSDGSFISSYYYSGGTEHVEDGASRQ